MTVLNRYQFTIAFPYCTLFVLSKYSIVLYYFPKKYRKCYNDNEISIFWKCLYII